MASHGGPEMLFAEIGEMMALIRINAENGERYAEAGDSQGLAYSVRRITAYQRAILPTLADLLEQFPSAGREEREWT